jgi:pimeloyl-ACP methyl ester carboxylesterase
VHVVELNEVRLRYTVAGDGPPVLLIQGVGLVGEGWRPQIDGLADRFTLIAFDNRGIGGSSLPKGRLTIDAMASDALALMSAIGFERFHVIGHSMGGLIAPEMALRQPARIASLALLCTFAHGKQGSRPSPGMLPTALRTRIGTRRMRRHAFLELVMPRDYLRNTNRDQLAERLRPLFGHDLADQPPIVMKQLGAMGRYDARDRLQQLAAIPTLVLSAAHDRIARPVFGRELARAIPGAVYVEIPDAGHGVTIHRASEVNELLAAHLARAESLRAEVV